MTFSPKSLGLLFVIFCLVSCSCMAQFHKPDSARTSLKWHQTKGFRLAVMPVALTATALSTMAVDDHTKLSKYSIQSKLMDRPMMLETSVDDQLRYVPAALVYGLNMVGVKGKNNFGERSLLLTKSILVQHFITTGMKRGFRMPRPGGSGHSFPSAHTARAFATATFMHQEYKDVSPWYSVAAYTFATATATLRVVNNHHWLPDVLVGAGVGILSTNLVYLTHRYQLTKWMDKMVAGRRNNERNLTLIPSYMNGAAGLYMTMTL